jgi:hypothetical protein
MPLKFAVGMRRFDWPAVALAYLFLFDSIFYTARGPELMRYLDFRAFSVVYYVQSTTVLLCKTMNEILVTPSILQWP